jgi:4-amino-4-deoxy-L-arabinose transferase-like glycosyltransferase
MKFWNAENTMVGWRFGIIVPVLISVLFFDFAMPIGILLAGLMVVFLFFFGVNYFSSQWIQRSFDQLELRIFLIALLVRIVFLGYLYLLTFWFDPGSFPFEINAADSWVYHNVTLELADAPMSQWIEIIEARMKSRSDFGYPIYQGLLYSFFGPNTIVVRLFNAVLGSATIVIIGRIVNISWGDAHARMTSIIGMLFPTLIWYCGIQLKETLMIFLVVLSFYLIWRLRYQSKWNLWFIVLAFVICFSLFFFRTFLAALVFVSMMLLFIPFRKNVLSSTLIVSLMLAVYLFYSLAISSDVFSDVNSQIEDSSDFFSRNLENEKSLLGDVKFDQVALAPLIVAGAAITPFPSYLNTEARQLSIFSRFQNDLVRNMMYFFMYVGLYYTFKKRFKEYIGIIFFLVAYLGVITSAANSFQARFHMPIIPFVVIFIGVGVVEFKSRSNRAWLVYLLFIFIAQLSWTYFKLNIRGINA